ncbi:hypothetical protein [Rothia aerolata]|nr:hypothetical protein [Rothia aerolata]
MSKPKNHPSLPLYTLQDAATQGLSREQVTRRGTQRVAHTLYQREGYQPSETELLLAQARTMPGCIVTAISAAKLLGLRLPPRLFKEKKLYVAQGEAASQFRRKNIRCSTASIERHETVVIQNIRCTTPLRTFLDLAKFLTVQELVAVADGLLVFHQHRRDQNIPLVSRTEFEEFLSTSKGKAGISKCRAAYQRAVTGSDSYMETALRLMLEDAGVQGISCNIPIFDDFGYLLFQPDLALQELKISIQYEGIHHGERDQIRRDVRRARAVKEAGWVEIRIFRDDFYEKVFYQGDFVPRALALVLEVIAERRAFLGLKQAV